MKPDTVLIIQTPAWTFPATATLSVLKSVGVMDLNYVVWETTQVFIYSTIWN